MNFRLFPIIINFKDFNKISEKYPDFTFTKSFLKNSKTYEKEIILVKFSEARNSQNFDSYLIDQTDL